MSSPPPSLQLILDAASVSPSIFALRPDYRALLIAISGITPSPSTPHSEFLLIQAESSIRDTPRPVTEIPHIAAWRDAYKSFGAKPAKFRNSLEALTRRIGAESGLPRVNRLTDIYNAVSVRRQIPLGGEDLGKYRGAPRLIRATGEEAFETMSSGQAVVEHPLKGEVVWVDDLGVTCRCWNWRQGPRTALTEETTAVLFICDALEAMSDAELEAVGDELVEALRERGDQLEVARRIIRKTEEE